jgi:hypothetical protein
MTSNIILEMRQLDAIDVVANGDYECRLSKDVIIENGDIVMVNKVFVDTVREGDININDDLTLTIQSTPYFNDWLQKLSNTWVNADGQSIDPNTEDITPNFKRFIPYLGLTGAPVTGFSTYTGYQYNINFVGSSEPPFTITYSFINYQNELQTFHTSFPALERRTHTLYTDAFNIIAKDGSVKIISPDISVFTGIGITPVGAVGSPLTSKVYSPFVMTTNITLPKGVYSPTQLSTVISERLSLNNANNIESDRIAVSKFLFACTDFDTGRDSPDGRINPTTGLPVLLTEQTTFISDDGEISTRFPTDSNILLGSSQVALEFDADSNKFQFRIHSDMLDATNGSAICVRYLHYALNSDERIVGVAENSGIFINSLTAKNSKGVTVDFWQGQLGFDLGSICVKSNYAGDNLFGLTGSFNLINPLVDGVTATNGYFGLDSSIIRGASTWYQRQSVPNTQAGISSTINSIVAINASSTLDVLLNKFSHYVLMTDLGFSNNNYIGTEWYRNINGVISKYFSYGSYAFGSTDTAIQYVHSGAPIFLSSIRIRLLKSDKKIDANLGDDNTVILQVIKSGSPQSINTAPVATKKA